MLRILSTILTLTLLASPAFAWSDNIGQAETTMRLKELSGTVSRALATCGEMTYRPRSITDGVFSIYGLTTAESDAVTSASDVTTDGTLIGTFDSTDNGTTATFSPAAGDTRIRIISTTPEESRRSEVVLTCNFGAGGGGETTLTQTIPIQQEYVSIQADVTNPDTFSIGTGVTLETLGTLPNLEPNPKIGWWYNFTQGPSGSIDNNFEHAFYNRVESNWKNAAATGDDTFVEFNEDVYPPDNESVVTGKTGPDFVVGETITFTTSGATAEVLAWDSGTATLEFRMASGGSPATNDAITAPSGAAAALGNTVTYLGGDTGHKFRPYLNIWKTLANTASFNWSTSPTDTNVLQVNSGGVAINFSGGVIEDSVVIGTRTGSTGVPALSARYVSGGSDGGGAITNSSALDLGQDYTGTDYLYSSASALRILPPTGPINTGSGSDYDLAKTVWIYDQKVSGQDLLSNSSSIYIANQGCGTTTPCNSGFALRDSEFGNMVFEGFEWNNGHLKVDSTFQGDHFYRDQTNEVWRSTTDSAPQSATWGEAFVTHTDSDIYAPEYGIIADATIDSGDEVCAAVGVGGTCVANSVWDHTAGVARACTDGLIPTGNRASVMCK